MTDGEVEDFISSMLADQPPKVVHAVADEDTAILRLAIELRANQGERDWPDWEFVERLHRRLATTRRAGAVLRLVPTGPWPRDAAGTTPGFSNAPSHGRGKRLGRLAALSRVAAAAAAFFIAGLFTAITLEGGRSLSLAGQHVARASVIRSGELLAADGRDLGQAYTFRGRPSWVLMDVDAVGLAGTYVCVLQLRDGGRIKAGIMVVHTGRGEWAHTVNIAVSQFRSAVLETSMGEVIATATLG
jgi:hypothetical protein